MLFPAFKAPVLALLFSMVCAYLPAAPVIPHPLPPSPTPVEDILKLQIFLDTQLFGPGVVDGRPGNYTSIALKRYQKSQGLPETELAQHELDLSSVQNLYTTYTVRAEDFKFVGPVPRKPSEQSKLKYMPYTSILELITERYHTTADLVQHLNPGKKLSTLKAGDVVTVPNVEPFIIEDMKMIASQPEVPEFKSRVIKIDTREKMLDLYDGEKLLASLPITPGSGYVATPPGTWKIVGIVHLPTFRWDDSVLKYGVRSSNFYEVPRGPNNPVGIMWIGLNKRGIGIHGTNTPDTIGRSASAGCIRTANWDTIRLSKHLTKGMTVIIEGPKAIPRSAPVVQKPSTAPAATTPRKAVPAAIPVAEPVKPKRRWFFNRD